VNKGSALTDITGRAEEGAALLEQARADARAAGDVFNESRALTNLLSFRFTEWPFEQSRQVLDEALRLAERAGRSGSPVSVWATWSAELAVLEGDMAAVHAFLVEGRRRDPSALAGGEGLWYVAYEIGLAIEAGEFEQAGELLAANPPASLPHPDHGEPWLL